jgi:hypothetical protein
MVGRMAGLKVVTIFEFKKIELIEGTERWILSTHGMSGVC